MSIATFLPEVFTHFRPTAAVLPSWSALARAMADPIPMKSEGSIVEFGPGTGPMTLALLERMPKDGKLLAFEVNPRFCDYLGETIRDPRLELLNIPAQRAAEILHERGWAQVVGVVSTLGLTLMPPRVRSAIIDGIGPYLGERGVLTQVQYLHRGGMGPFLRRRFQSVGHRTVWRNVPPAGFFVCRGYAGIPTGETD